MCLPRRAFQRGESLRRCVPRASVAHAFDGRTTHAAGTHPGAEQISAAPTKSPAYLWALWSQVETVQDARGGRTSRRQRRARPQTLLVRATKRRTTENSPSAPQDRLHIDPWHSTRPDLPLQCRCPLSTSVPQVQPIVEKVRQEGDAAVREYTAKFDKVQLTDVCIKLEVPAPATHRPPPTPDARGRTCRTCQNRSFPATSQLPSMLLTTTSRRSMKPSSMRG
jgi:hypothetical protein